MSAAGKKVLAANVSDDDRGSYFVAEDNRELWQLDGETISAGQCRHCGVIGYTVDASNRWVTCSGYAYADGWVDGCGKTTLIDYRHEDQVVFP